MYGKVCMVFSAGECLVYWMFSVWEGLHGVQCRWMLNVLDV